MAQDDKAAGYPALDEVDARLVLLLRRDGRYTYTQLGREVGMSEVSVRQRVKRLISEGIMRIIAVVDPYKLGYTFDATMTVSVDPAKVEAALHSLAQLSEIRYLASTAGEYNVTLTALFRDMDHMYDFLTNHLGRIDGVLRYTMMPILKVFKRTYDWVTPGLE